MFGLRSIQMLFMFDSYKLEYHDDYANVGVYAGLHKSQALGGSKATPFDRQAQQREAREQLLKRFNRKQMRPS